MRTSNRQPVYKSKRVRKSTFVRAPRPKQGPCIDWGRLRLGFVGAMFGLMWLALWGRAYYVQIVDGPRLAELALGQHLASEFVTGERGKIFDRRGRLLARSVEFQSVYAKPFQVSDPDAEAQVLAGILGQSPADIRGHLSGSSNYVWIARQVDDRAAAAIEAAGLPGVHLTQEYTRQYPCRHLAGQLIGFVGVDENGLEGLESSFDPYLAGSSAEMLVQRDASGHRLLLDADEDLAGSAGRDLWLTIDAHIQFVAEEALARAVEENQARWGASLVVSVESGEILAWAEYPFFNPNAYRQYSPGQWRNRVAMDALEPGSDMKPFIVAAALQEGVCDRDTLYFCENGSWRVKGKDINDTGSYAWLPVDGIVSHSSNIGAAKLATDLGAPMVHEYLTRLGFGERTGLPLTGESPGILRPAGEWNEFDVAAAGFGQGYAVTVLQLAQAYLCLGNMGVMRPLRIVRHTGETVADGPRVFDESVAREVLDMMRQVVEEDGTGTRAHIDGLTIAGKTSTAQKADPEGGYGDKYVASFVGMTPASDPKLMIIVVIDEPLAQYYGGAVAAPAFREIMVETLAYMGGLPDAPADVLQVEAEPDEFLEGPAEEPAQETAEEEPAADPQGENVAWSGTGVPSVVGMSVRSAVEIFAHQGLIPVLEGEGAVVVRQQPQPGGDWPEVGNGDCILWLGNGDERPI